MAFESQCAATPVVQILVSGNILVKENAKVRNIQQNIF